MPANELRRRLTTRIGDISDATVELLQKQQQDFEDFASDEIGFVKRIDTTQPVNVSILD